jgi:hypothetical protein
LEKAAWMKAHANQKEKPAPVAEGLENRASEPAGGFIGILIAAAKRQDELIETLICAVESGDQPGINEAARAIAVHRCAHEPANTLRT